MLVNDHPVLDSRFTSLFDMKELEAPHADNDAVFRTPYLQPPSSPFPNTYAFFMFVLFFVFYTFPPHFACSTEYGYELDSD